MTPAIQIQQVHKRFGAVQALSGIDLEVAPGEFFGLLGPNGAGKTTLINILAGLARADAGSAILGTLGLVAGIWAEKFDPVAAFQSFLIVPLTFLSGVFYSIHSLPVFWQALSHLNPFFYMIDGFRYGFFGVSDIDPMLSLIISAASLLALTALTLALLKRGYKLRH